MPLFGVENKLPVNRLPLITSLCEELSPRGEATDWRSLPEGESKDNAA